MSKDKVKPREHTREMESIRKQLILFNDDFNTFDFVIETLVELCDHDAYQAEQCALIAHYNGKCTVKSGSYDELSPICNEMTNRNLTVSIK